MGGEPKKNPFWSLLFSAVLSQILAERPIDALKRRTRAAFSRVISPLRKKDPTKVLEKEKREETFFEDQTERMRDLYNGAWCEVREKKAKQWSVTLGSLARLNRRPGKSNQSYYDERVRWK